MPDSPGNPRPPMEPHADIRGMAGTARQMFLAYVEQGFTENQALYLVASIVGQGPKAP